jgi:hypothetical protein
MREPSAYCRVVPAVRFLPEASAPETRRGSRASSAWAWGGATFAGIATLLVLFPLARYGIDPHHDGLVFKGALDFIDGQVPHRDSYNQYGPLLPVILGTFLWVFGATLLSLKASAVIFYALSAALMVFLWKRLVVLPLALFTWAVWLTAQPEVTSLYFPTSWWGVVHPWSSVYALAFSMGACLLLVRAFADARWRNTAAVAAGVLGGITFHLRWPVGVSVLVGLVLGALLWMPGTRRVFWKTMVLFAAGLSVAVVSVVIWLAAEGALGAAWAQAYAEPQAWSATISDAKPQIAQALFVLGGVLCLPLALLSLLRLCGDRLGSLTRRRSALVGLGLAWLAVTLALWRWQWDWVVQWFSMWNVQIAAASAALALTAVALASVLGGAVLRRRARWSDKAFLSWTRSPVVLVVCFAAASLTQFYPVFEPRHVFWAATPALGVLAWLCWEVSGRRTLLVVALGVTFLVPPATLAWERAGDRVGIMSAPAPSAVPSWAGMRVTPDFLERYGPLVKALEREYRERPDAPMLMMGPDALWLTLGTNLSNPDRYFVSWPVMGDAERRARFIARERPLIWFEYPFTNAPVPAYLDLLGYRVAYHLPPVRPGEWDRWLLAPGPTVRKPPYRWDRSRPGFGPLAPPAAMWATP